MVQYPAVSRRSHLGHPKGSKDDFRRTVELWPKVGDGERRGWRIVGVTNLPHLQEE